MAGKQGMNIKSCWEARGGVVLQGQNPFPNREEPRAKLGEVPELQTEVNEACDTNKRQGGNREKR